MLIRVDCAMIPPAVSIEDPDDFASFKVLVDVAPHVWISPEMIASLVAAPTGEWRNDLQKMTACAARKGWSDACGNIRAHVEVAQ